MAKSSNRYGNNAQSRGGEGWLADSVKGDCTQLWNNGMTKTEGMFKIDTPSVDSYPDDPTTYHRPFFGVTSRKQPSGDKE